MEPQENQWLPLTEYALRSGVSISTLRRKIKSNTIEYKMEEGRYLIRSDDLSDAKTITGFLSSDDKQPAQVPSARPTVSAPAPIVSTPAASPLHDRKVGASELEMLREDFRQMQEDNLLRWKALEARVAGLAKKLEFFSEQMAEAKMLVKLFEEKLDHRA